MMVTTAKVAHPMHPCNCTVFKLCETPVHVTQSYCITKITPFQLHYVHNDALQPLLSPFESTLLTHNSKQTTTDLIVLLVTWHVQSILLTELRQPISIEPRCCRLPRILKLVDGLIVQILLRQDR